MKVETRFFPYTNEGLTPQNMRTPKNAEYFGKAETLHHDLTLMNAQQLQRYMKMAFLETRDETFLPKAFWRQAFQGVSGSGGGRSPDGASKFFGNTAGFVGRICYKYPESTNPDEQSWVGYPVHVEYRNNLRSALTNILLEATWINHPTAEQMKLATGAVETVGWIAEEEGCEQGFPDDTQNQPLFRSALTMIDAMRSEPAFAQDFDPLSELSLTVATLHRATIHR
jgi:hypothetical protein